MNKGRQKRSTKNIKPSLDIQHFIDQSSDESVRKMNQELMVGKYIEECRNAKTKNPKPGSRSPYLYTNEMVINNSNNNASTDLDSSYDVNKTYSQITARKFLPHPPRKGRRPDSAPVYRLGIGSWTGFEDLTNSETSSVAMFSTASTARKYKPIYKRKKRVLCVLAFVNGSRETYARVTAPDLPQLLVECTTKLGLNTAARKLFLRDGTHVVHPKMLIKDCEVFVSTGEPFKDPMMNLEGREKLRKSSYWTLNGIQVPSSAKRSKRISSAFTRRMTESEQKRRILVFRNGECSDGVEVIAGRYDEFLIDCTTKLGMTSNVRGLYDWTGNAIEDLTSVPMLDKVLQPSTGIMLGPLWATKGETFSPKGSYNFLSTMVMNTKERMGECTDKINRLQEQMVEQKALMDVEAEIDEQVIFQLESEQNLAETWPVKKCEKSTGPVIFVPKKVPAL